MSVSISYLDSTTGKVTYVTDAVPLPVTAIAGTGASSITVQGAGVNGSAVVGNPVLTAGYDGTNTRRFLTDTAGRMTVTGAYSVGSAAPSSALVGSMVASDGTNGRLINTDTSGRQIAAPWTYNNITSATTTTAKSGAGVLHAVAINTYIASATITIYDNTAGSGTKIGTLTLPSTITGLAPVTVLFDASFATGLTLVTSGATDLTVLYR